MVEISDLIRTERALEDSNMRLGLAGKVVDFASWQWNTKTGYFSFNESFEKLLGRQEQTFKNTYKAFLDTIHPDDRPEFIEKVTAAVEAGKDFEIFHRVRLADGSERLLKHVGVASVGPDGKRWA